MSLGPAGSGRGGQGWGKGGREDKPESQVVREVKQMPKPHKSKQAALRQTTPKKTKAPTKSKATAAKPTSSAVA